MEGFFCKKGERRKASANIASRPKISVTTELADAAVFFFQEWGGPKIFMGHLTAAAGREKIVLEEGKEGTVSEKRKRPKFLERPNCFFFFPRARYVGVQ